VAGPFAWALLGFFYVVLGFIYQVNSGVVEHNLTGQPLKVGASLVVLPVAVLLFIAIYLVSRRGEPLPEQGWLADETHASPLWGLAFLAPMALELGIFAAVPQAAMRVGGALLGGLFLLLAIFAWSGFHYRFSAAGVEIRSLGFRLRSIPVAQ